MGADDLLDQDRWLGEPREMVTVDQQIRSTALVAAATWLAGESPYPQGVPFVLQTAERFAGWIETGEKPKERL